MRMLVPSTRRLRRLWLSAALGLVVVLAGCASVNRAPFAEFAASLERLRSGSDTQAEAAVDALRQDLIQRVASGEISAADLQLEIDHSDSFTTRYGFGEEEPEYIKFVRFQNGLSALNGAMLAYAQSLVMLAGADQGGDVLPSADQFDQMARDLNANASTAAAALGVSVDSDSQGLLSAVAIRLFRAYIETKRSATLREAIAEVQSQVDEFSTAARLAVRTLASLVQTDYTERILPLLTASPPNATPILALNDTTQATLATLESLFNSYGALPAAHRDLSAAASSKPGTLAGLVALTNEATRLRGLVTELRAVNAAVDPTPPTE